MSSQTFFSMISQMLVGSGQVIQIFAFTVVFAVPLGMLCALGRRSRHAVISGPIRFYQLIMRGTPLMLQLMFFMFGPYYISHWLVTTFGIGHEISMNRFAACIIAFVVNYAAYFGEIFRAGIASVPAGQYEAGKVLGYTKRQTFFHIVLPQVVKQVLPPMGSEFMVLVKDTALASIIAQPQLFDVAKKLANAQVSVLPLLVAGVFFLVMNAVVEYAFKLAENKLAYYQ